MDRRITVHRPLICRPDQLIVFGPLDDLYHASHTYVNVCWDMHPPRDEIGLSWAADRNGPIVEIPRDLFLCELAFNETGLIVLESDWLNCVKPHVMMDFVGVGGLGHLTRRQARRKFDLLDEELSNLGMSKLDDLVYDSRYESFRWRQPVFVKLPCDLLREVFGNPWTIHQYYDIDCPSCKGELQPSGHWFPRRFCSNCDGTVDLPQTPWLLWNDKCIPKLARQIFADKTFDQMTILADALQEAGCTDEEILKHCLSNTKHVRGCWVIDLFMGE